MRYHVHHQYSVYNNIVHDDYNTSVSILIRLFQIRPEIGSALWSVVAKLMAKNAEDGYQGFSSSSFSPPGCLIDRSAYVSRQITKVCCMTCRRYRKRSRRACTRTCQILLLALKILRFIFRSLLALSCTLFMALTLQQRYHKSYTEEKKRWGSWQETSSKCAVKALYPACWCWFVDLLGYLFFHRFSFVLFFFFFVVPSRSLIFFFFSFFSFSFSTVYMIYNTYQVGKTLLVNEVHRPLAKSYGNYISGKFDQFFSASPYSAIIQVNLSFPSHTTMEELTSIHRHWSSWFNRFSPRARRHWKSGNIGWSRGWKEMVNWWQIWSLIWSLLLVCISNLRLFFFFFFFFFFWQTLNGGKKFIIFQTFNTFYLGPQPEVPALEAVENVHRFKDVFIGFISSLARKERPLVIFLDDLQCMYHTRRPHSTLTFSLRYSLSIVSLFHFTLSHIHTGADSNTLDLLLALLTNREASRASYLLIVGAYRDNEVSEKHLLSAALGEIRSKGGIVEDVSVSALREEQVVQLLDDTFNGNHSMSARREARGERQRVIDTIRMDAYSCRRYYTQTGSGAVG